MNEQPAINLRPPTPAWTAAPVVIDLPRELTPRQAAQRFAHLPHMLIMESSMRHSSLGRYSFLMADPVQWFQPIDDEIQDTFAWLRKTLQNNSCETHSHLPPFQGGVAGLFEYEFNQAIEKIGTHGLNSNTIDQQTSGPTQPPVSLGVYDVTVAWDHESSQVLLISQGLPADSEGQRHQVAKQRADFFQRLLKGEAHRSSTVNNFDQATRKQEPSLKSDFERDAYLLTIQKALDYIHAGDIFQVNIAQQITHPAFAESLELYDSLCECNPSTFAAWFDTGHSHLISASPERLLKIRDRNIESRPIKGTRRRTHHPEIDIDAGLQLRQSEKDRAENVMIVDLMRNDLSRVCTDDSVRVTQFVQLEQYASVLHLVSAISGRLRDDVTAADVMAALFPGGSITGAPKIRAMEIIDELERSTRGAYCGSLGYFSFDGSADLNILIRTVTQQDGQWKIPVGGGIVVGSDPVDEYEETWTKASGMIQAIEKLKTNGQPISQGSSTGKAVTNQA